MRKKKGPWTVTATKVVYKNPWMTVIEDKVIRPDGEAGIFSTMNQRGGSSVIAMDSENNVYLTREYHYAVGRVTFEAISGGMEGKETPLQTAKRELKEEAGITARTWVYLGVVDPLTTSVSSPNHMYFARGLTFGKSNLDATETLEIVKVPFKKALQMTIDSKITHGGSVAAILKVARLLKL